MSYIDREALIERLCYVCGADCDKNICTVKQTVEYMPDADVEPIRHGRWIKMSDADGDYYACSECGEELPRKWSFDREFDIFPKKRTVDKTHYCPNCGALMDKREADT